MWDDAATGKNAPDRIGRGRGFDDIQMNPAAACASERPIFRACPSRDDAQDRQGRVAIRTMG